MTLALTGYKLYPVHLPYRRPVRWAGHGESGLNAMILTLETAGGLIGVGEAPVRLNWSAATLKSLAVVVEEVFLPRLMGEDLADEAETTRFLRYVREHTLAKAMIDCAIWDLRAQAADQPLYRHLGGKPEVPVAWTVTRAEPRAMIKEAEAMVARYGFTSLKIKTGQGFETDREVLAGIRAAVGPDVTFSSDSNRGYSAEEVGPFTDMLAEFGVKVAEDPTELHPYGNFAEAKAASRLPLLIDNTCRTLDEAEQFLAVGADALSVKVFKTGIADSREIIRQAEDKGTAVHIGISAASSLCAVSGLALAGALAPHADGLPSEESFFLQFAREFVTEPLTVEDGMVRLPDRPLHDWIDWAAVKDIAV
ncbi:MAG: mandelate racemase/muconate lactonizing enzyme family protein [Alphaproteobacteria bacterium]|nr:mandelate racemase/muconate lactonizing enzyme family protein [Alphaproteobacteria bacterium]